MSQGPQIKRFILRALLAAGTTPMPADALTDAIKHGVLPRPLESDIELWRNDLETRGLIIGDKDPVDDSVAWTLTKAGVMQAKQH